MQRFFASSSFTKGLTITNNTFSHHYKAFTSLSRPTENQYQCQFLSSSLAHPFLSWRSQQSLSRKILGFLSNPVLAKQFLLNISNTHLRIPSKSLVDSRVWFLRAQYPKRRLEFEPGFGFQRRGWRSWFQRLSASDMVLGLIIANVAVFLAWQMADRGFMMNNFTISLDNFKSGRVHTLITSAFSHIDAEHIVSNMIGLYFFGMSIGRAFGPEYLLKLYLAGAVGGSVFFLVHHAVMASSSKGQEMFRMDPSKIPGLIFSFLSLSLSVMNNFHTLSLLLSTGASGAVNAIMLLDIFLHPKSTLYFEFFIPVPAILLGIFLIVKDMLRITEGNSHISGSAHLGGAAVAAIAWARIKRGRF